MKRELGTNFERLRKLAATAESADATSSMLLEGAGLELLESAEVEIDWPRTPLGRLTSGVSLRGAIAPNRFTLDPAAAKTA